MSDARGRANADRKSLIPPFVSETRGVADTDKQFVRYDGAGQ